MKSVRENIKEAWTRDVDDYVVKCAGKKGQITSFIVDAKTVWGKVYSGIVLKISPKIEFLREQIEEQVGEQIKGEN